MNDWSRPVFPQTQSEEKNPEFPEESPAAATPTWNPFRVAAPGTRADTPRPLLTTEGKADRLRCAAFAEIQAREAFTWAAAHFKEAPEKLRKTWLGLAKAEHKHLHWLLERMKELEITVQERSVSTQLWHSLQACQSAREFALYMASAEERGRKAGIRFYEAFGESDPVTAKIFKKIADEEVAHIELAQRFFPAYELQS